MINQDFTPTCLGHSLWRPVREPLVIPAEVMGLYSMLYTIYSRMSDHVSVAPRSLVLNHQLRSPHLKPVLHDQAL